MKTFASLDSKYDGSSDLTNSNVLILLHGLGDTRDNFASFSFKMQLPQTAIVSLQGPFKIPFFDEGSGWMPSYDEEGLEYLSQDVIVRGGLEKTRSLLEQFLKECVIHSTDNPTGFSAEKIFLLGFGVGAQVGLDLVLFGDIPKLGGFVSISGSIDEGLYSQIASRKLDLTPTLITFGDQEDKLKEKIDVMKGLYSKGLEVFIAKDKGQSMPKGEEEMSCIMGFFSKHLWLRNLALEKMANEILEIEKL